MKINKNRLLISACMSLLLLGCDGDDEDFSQLVPGLTEADGALPSSVITRTDAKQINESWGELDLHLEKASTYGTKNMITGIADIKPGQEIHPPHEHSDEEFLYIAKGTGQWTLNEEQFDAKQGDLLYASPWDLHGVTNTGSETLTFYFFRWNGLGVPAPAEEDVQLLFEAIASGVFEKSGANRIEESWGTLDLYLDEKKTFATKKMVTGVAEILPGQEIHPPHKHEEEEFLYIVQGSGTWTLNEKTIEAKQGDLLYATPDDLHGVKNTGNENLIFYFMKWNNKGVVVPKSE